MKRGTSVATALLAAGAGWLAARMWRNNTYGVRDRLIRGGERLRLRGEQMSERAREATERAERSLERGQRYERPRYGEQRRGRSSGESAEGFRRGGY